MWKLDKIVGVVSFMSIIIVAFFTKGLYIKRESIDISMDYGCMANDYSKSKSKYKSSKCISPEYKQPIYKSSNYEQTNSGLSVDKRSCRSMFEIQKSTGQNWDKDDPYEALSWTLPPLLVWPPGGSGAAGASSNNNFNTSNSSSRDINTHNNSRRYFDPKEDVEPLRSSANQPILLNKTRLQVLKGRVPYLPCKIQDYSADDVETCVISRAAAGASTWVAFVGTSKMREKVHQFLVLLPENLNYKYFFKEKQVSREVFVDSLNKHQHGDYDVIGYTNDESLNVEKQKIKLTVIWEAYGTGNLYKLKQTDQPSTRFHKLASTDGSVPDVVVIGLGTWYLIEPATSDNAAQLEPYDVLDFNARILQHTLQQITKKTKVILWAHGRFRQYHFLSEPRPPGKISPYKENRFIYISPVNKWYYYLLYHHTLSYSIGYMDSWLANIILRNNQVWRWDSTLPFHYANIRDCSSWRPSAVKNYPNGTRIVDQRFKDNWWRCLDTHHSSYSTNHDEAVMLLNMLCNPYSTNTTEDTCC